MVVRPVLQKECVFETLFEEPVSKPGLQTKTTCSTYRIFDENLYVAIMKKVAVLRFLRFFWRVGFETGPPEPTISGNGPSKLARQSS